MTPARKTQVSPCLFMEVPPEGMGNVQSRGAAADQRGSTEHDQAAGALTLPVLGMPSEPQLQVAADGTTTGVGAASSSSSEAGPSSSTAAVDEEEGGVNECVICLNEMSADEPRQVCGHRFHGPCIEEWLEKDGRCPVCRHQIREPPVQQPSRMDVEALRLARDIGLRSLANTAMLILESRRLMMLAAMEAALAVLVMSYISDILSPAMMILASAVTFSGASNYLPRVVALARPLLAINVCYHIYLMSVIMQAGRGNSEGRLACRNEPRSERGDRGIGGEWACASPRMLFLIRALPGSSFH